MRRTSLITILVFVTGLVIGYFARSAAGMLQRSTHAADLAAIEKAHHEDIEATLTQDPKGLIDLWAEDAVNFIPGSPPDVTGVFCTSGSEREFTLEGSWYADEEIQAGADRDVVATG
jgi:hypothetical protein